MEIEFKFQVPAERLQALDKDMQRARTTRTHLLARYFDTADGTLAAHGVALRLRKEGRRWVQAAKALGEGPLQRLEHEVDLGAPRAGPPAVDPARHAGTPVGERLAALLARSGAPLVQTFATDIWRRARVQRLGGTTVELALDVGRVLAPAGDGRGDISAPVCELELELVAGAPAGLLALAQRWSARHGLWFSTLSKAERGERLRSKAAGTFAVKAAPPDFGDAARGGGVAVSGIGLQRAVLAACLAQILPNAAELAAGGEDAEAIHQLRVGIRRLRSALRELEALAPGQFDPAWEPPLVEAFRVLGAQRDRELLRTRLQPRLQAAGAPDFAWPEDTGTAPPFDAGALVRAPAFQALLVDLVGRTLPAAEAPPPSRDEARATRAAVAAKLEQLHRQVRRDGRRFETLSEAAQHRVRKRLKRLRYLAEFVAPLFAPAKAKRYLARLMPAQDALGEFNDDVVALAALRTLAAQAPRAWFAVGWLSALQPAQATACRKALAKLGKARKFWT